MDEVTLAKLDELIAEQKRTNALLESVPEKLNAVIGEIKDLRRVVKVIGDEAQTSVRAVIRVAERTAI